MQKPLLAILIATLTERQKLLDRLMDHLHPQMVGQECIVIHNIDNRVKTTGQKRNELIDAAIEENATHIAFFDDDDLPGPNYIQRNMEGVNGDYDCNELYGRIYFHNKPGNLFHHSIEYDHWFQTDKMYMRMPNHLSTIKLAHLHDIRFQDKTIGEDFWYSEEIRKTGRLKRQYPIKEVIYHYYNGNKNHKLEPGLAKMTGISIY